MGKLGKSKLGKLVFSLSINNVADCKYNIYNNK